MMNLLYLFVIKKHFMNFVYKYVNKVPVIGFLDDAGNLPGFDVKVLGEKILSLVAENKQTAGHGRNRRSVHAHQKR